MWPGPAIQPGLHQGTQRRNSAGGFGCRRPSVGPTVFGELREVSAGGAAGAAVGTAVVAVNAAPGGIRTLHGAGKARQPGGSRRTVRSVPRGWELGWKTPLSGPAAVWTTWS